MSEGQSDGSCCPLLGTGQEVPRAREVSREGPGRHTGASPLLAFWAGVEACTGAGVDRMPLKQWFSTRGDFATRKQLLHLGILEPGWGSVLLSSSG